MRTSYSGSLVVFDLLGPDHVRSFKARLNFPLLSSPFSSPGGVQRHQGGAWKATRPPCFPNPGNTGQPRELQFPGSHTAAVSASAAQTSPAAGALGACPGRQLVES